MIECNSRADMPRSAAFDLNTAAVVNLRLRLTNWTQESI